jgi:hypothetical protein
MSDLMQKLALSKKIMEVQDRIPRGQSRDINYNNSFEESIPDARYNIPQEVMMETQKAPSQMNVSKAAPQERIVNSKLPDDIKRLMIENPIVQPSSMGGDSVLSDEIIAGATRLMGNKQKTNESRTNQGQSQTQNILESTDLKQMIRDVVRDTVRDVVKEELKNMSIISESNSNETLQLRVGSHVFEGKVTKIKKIK